jgi:hypothetical protein
MGKASADGWKIFVLLLLLIILERSQKVYYIAVNGRMTHEWWIGKQVIVA